jgi:hypothetical protein
MREHDSRGTCRICLTMKRDPSLNRYQAGLAVQREAREAKGPRVKPTAKELASSHKTIRLTNPAAKPGQNDQLVLINESFTFSEYRCGVFRVLFTGGQVVLLADILGDFYEMGPHQAKES